MDKDYAIRCTAAEGTVRIFACTTKNLTNEASEIHKCSATAATALGRTLTAGAMMGTMMLKNEKDKLTLHIKSQGPIGTIIVTADKKGNVKGEVSNPQVENFFKNGKLDVGEAVWPGVLNVIKDLGLKEPYVGQVPIISGEIAEDLTEYFMSSEQVPSLVALSVFVNRDNSLMPGAKEEIIQHLENFFKDEFSMSSELSAGKAVETIVQEIFEGFDLEILEHHDLKYSCDCSRERFRLGMMSLGKKELRNIVEEDGKADIRCQFCGKEYHFDRVELIDMVEKVSS